MIKELKLPEMLCWIHLEVLIWIPEKGNTSLPHGF